MRRFYNTDDRISRRLESGATRELISQQIEGNANGRLGANDEDGGGFTRHRTRGQSVTIPRDVQGPVESPLALTIAQGIIGPSPAPITVAFQLL